VQFIDDADRTHAESHFDSNPGTHCESGSSAGTDSFTDASIANADAIAIADAVPHAITNAFAFTDAGSKSCTTTNDDVHVLGNRQRRAGPSGCRRHRTRRSRFGDH
jgi:hypothetical protein